MPFPSAVSNVPVTSIVGMVIPPLRLQTLPSASASRPTSSVMVCAGPSLAGVVRRVSRGLDVTNLLALLVRPCVVSLTVGEVLIVSTPSLMRRVVSVCSGYLHRGAERKTVGGGCTAGSLSGTNVAKGKNCKAIPNVDKVLCDRGACKIISCKDGFDPAGDHCVKSGLNGARKT